MRIGIDFGSTYTTLSRYRVDHGVIEAFEDKGNAYIPTVISLNENNKVHIGGHAKNSTGDEGVRTYKAFKMLLGEKNDDLLRIRQYDSEHTPEWAAGQFMTNLVKKAQSRFKDKNIEKIVVGAPEVWFQKFETLSGRAILRDVCLSMDGVGNESIQIVSEPVLASAYFAYNFQKKCHKAFEGNILIIDYGGGTLDLSLTEIRNYDSKSAEIRMLESDGAGENTDHSIGNAGIVYMESLLEYVIRKYNPSEADDVIGTSEFYKAVNSLEGELMEASEDIRSLIEGMSIKRLDKISEKRLKELEEEEMEFSIRCAGHTYEFTYADLVNVYMKVIYPVFEEKMDHMIKLAVEKHHIDVFDKRADGFRIALVGGFGNFYLVRKQMREKFEISNTFDRREEDILENEQDCERAISYGAALIASDIFAICNTAPYSMGIILGIDNKNVNYMVGYHDKIDLDKPYYLKDTSGEDKYMIMGDGWAKAFVINHGEKEIRFRLKKEFQKKLENFVHNDFMTFGMGISFSGSDIVTLHIRDYDFYTKKFSDTKQQSFELGKFEEAFEEEK